MTTKIEGVELKFSKEFSSNNDCDGDLSLNICGLQEEGLEYAISINFNKENGEGVSAILAPEQLKQLKSALIGYDNYLKK